MYCLRNADETWSKFKICEEVTNGGFWLHCLADSKKMNQTNLWTILEALCGHLSSEVVVIAMQKTIKTIVKKPNYGPVAACGEKADLGH